MYIGLFTVCVYMCFCVSFVCLFVCTSALPIAPSSSALPRFTAVRTIVAIEHMIEIVETAVTAHFAAFSCVEDPEREWQVVCETMAVPDTIRDTFLSESVAKSSFLCLFGASLNELSQLKEPRNELDLAVKMTLWCSRMKPE